MTYMEWLVDDHVLLAHFDADELVVFEDMPTRTVGFLSELACFDLIGNEVKVLPLHHVLDGLPICRVVHELEEVLLCGISGIKSTLLGVEIDILIEDAATFELNSSVNLFGVIANANYK